MERESAGRNCPVCGMQVESDEFRLRTEEGTYVFCSPQCREKFIQDNEFYAMYPDEKPG